MFNRTTGAVDPKVIAYWKEHYDIAHHVEANWSTPAPDLTGKIHLFVGTEDTFYLDGAAHRLGSYWIVFDAQAQFTFVPGKTLFDLYLQGDERFALMYQIAAEMYSISPTTSRARK